MSNGIALGLSALAGVFLGWPALPIVLGALILLQTVERNLVPQLLIACAIVVTLGALRAPDSTQTEVNATIPTSTSAIGRVVSFPRPSGENQRIVLDISEVCINQQCVPASGRVVTYVPHQGSAIARGATIRVDWRFQEAKTLSPAYRDYVLSHQTIGSARATSSTVLSTAPRPFYWIAVAHEQTVEHMQRYIPGDAGALATGIVTGDDSALSDQAKADFQATGTTHITAVSGQNVSLIIGFLSLWYVPVTPRGRLLFHAVLVVVVWSYALFVGLEPPALRAAIFASLMIIGRHVGRRPDPITILCLTLGVMALINPWVVQSVGYWLSALASLALCLVMPTSLDHRPLKAAWQVVQGPVVASLVTMPLVMMAFGSWSPVSVIANMAIGPIISLAFPLCYAFALVALFLPFLAPYVAIIPTIVLNTALDTVHQLAPFASQIRVDELSPQAALILWMPIAVGIWLLSDECHRWLRRLVAAQGSG